MDIIERCLNCEWSKKLDGKNGTIACTYHEELRNIEDSCILWIPIPEEN